MYKSCLKQFTFYSNTNAFFGQKFEHLPHLMHFSLSTTGALNPSCESAPTGQILTEGHL